MEDLKFSKQLIPSLICGLACFISVVISSDLSSTTYVKKGGEFILLCQVRGLDGVHLWYKDGKAIRADSINKYHLEVGSLQYNLEEKQWFSIMKLTVKNADSIHTGDYKCNITGDHSQHVIVVTGDMIVTNEEEPGMGKLLTPGEPLILQCSTSDCPQCKIIWQRNGEPLSSIDNHIEIHDKNNSVVIKSATYNDTGVYICGITHGDLSISVNATIVVQSKIKLDRFDASSVVIEGSPLELICHPQGSPAPNIKWFIGNQEVFDDNERVELLEHGGLAKGKLLIHEAEYSDRNHYTCEAFNQLDRVNTTVFIRIKDKLAALWPFLGICAEVLILCSIIFIYEEKKRKNSNDEPETDLPTENKHHREQRGKGQDVRQRK